MAEAVLETDDLDAAAEEFLYAASHIARAILLRSEIFPLSRPEMPAQLLELDPGMATSLSQLVEGELSSASLQKIHHLLRARMESLTAQLELA